MTEEIKSASTPTSLSLLAKQIKEQWTKLETMEKTTEEARKAFGKLLLEAKEKVGHGNFGKWIEEHCSITWRTANRYMKLDSVSNSTSGNANTGADSSNANTDAPLPIDLLDKRMDGVLKAIDKVSKKDGVDAALEEIEKLKEKLDAKEGKLVKEKVATEKKKKAA
jgi:hypothetical protein